MPQRCKVCQHQELEKINAALVARKESNRMIAKHFSVHPSSIYRHYAEHLPLEMIQGRHLRKRLQADNLLDRLDQCFERGERILNACDRYLRDPEDPLQYDIGPRGVDVWITHMVPDIEGRMEKRKERLGQLLLDLQGSGIQVRDWSWKIADPRELILKASREAKGFLELYAKITGELINRIELINDDDAVVRLFQAIETVFGGKGLAKVEAMFLKLEEDEDDKVSG